MLPYVLLACTFAFGGDSPTVEGAIVSWEALLALVVAMLGIFGAPMAKVLLNQARMAEKLDHMDAMMGEVKSDVRSLYEWKEDARMAISRLELLTGDPPTGG